MIFSPFATTWTSQPTCDSVVSITATSVYVAASSTQLAVPSIRRHSLCSPAYITIQLLTQQGYSLSLSLSESLSFFLFFINMRIPYAVDQNIKIQESVRLSVSLTVTHTCMHTHMHTHTLFVPQQLQNVLHHTVNIPLSVSVKNRYQRVTITYYCTRQILEVYFHSILQILKRNFHTQSEVVNLWSYSYYSTSSCEQTYNFLCTDWFLLGIPENYSMTTLLIHNENDVVCHKTLVNQGSRCLLEICVNQRETLWIWRQWHEKCVQFNLQLTHITKPKWWSNLTAAHGL